MNWFVTPLAIVFFTSIAHGQDSGRVKEKGKSHKFFLRAGLGYGGVLAGKTQILENSIRVFNVSGENVSTVPGRFAENPDIKKASFGTGGYLAVAGSFMANRHIGIELGMQALLKPENYEFHYDYINDRNVRVLSYHKTQVTKPVYIIPALVLSTGGRLNLFTRLGLVLPVGEKISYTQRSVSMEQNIIKQETIRDYTLTQKKGTGFHAAFGASYPITSHCSLYAEFSGIYRNADAEELRLTAINGNPGIGNDRTIFGSYSVQYNHKAPIQYDVTSSIPFSSIGGSIGVMLGF